MIGALNWLPSTDVEDANKVFEVMPEFLFVPHATCCTAWSFHCAAELRPMVWPPFSCSRVNGPPKHPFPPNQVLMEDCVMGVRPTPWPSSHNSRYQVETQSQQQWLAVSGWNWQPWQPPIWTGKAEHRLFLLKSQSDIDEQMVQIRTSEWKLEEGNTNLDILVQGRKTELFYELLISDYQGIQYVTRLRDRLFFLVLDGCMEDAQAAILVYLGPPLLSEMLLLHFGGRYLSGWNIQVEKVQVLLQIQVLKMKLSPLRSYCKVGCTRSLVTE